MQIFFHCKSLVLGMGQLVFLGAIKFFWGASQFFGGPGGQSVFKSTGPPGHWTHMPNVKAF